MSKRRLPPAVQAILDNAPRSEEQELSHLDHLAAIANGGARGLGPIQPQGEEALAAFEASLDAELLRQEGLGGDCFCDPRNGDYCDACEHLIDEMGDLWFPQKL